MGFRDRVVEQLDVAQVLGLGAVAQHGAPRGIVEKRETGIVELQIGAAERGEAFDLLAVDRGEIGVEHLPVGIDVAVDAAAGRIMHHRRRGNGELRHRLGRDGSEEREILGEDRVVEPHALADPIGHEFEIERAGCGAERYLHRIGQLLDAADRVFEIHEPVDAAELAVGHRLKPDVLLAAHDLADRFVLDRAATRPP